MAKKIMQCLKVDADEAIKRLSALSNESISYKCDKNHNTVVLTGYMKNNKGKLFIRQTGGYNSFPLSLKYRIESGCDGKGSIIYSSGAPIVSWVMAIILILLPSLVVLILPMSLFGKLLFIVLFTCAVVVVVIICILMRPQIDIAMMLDTICHSSEPEVTVSNAKPVGPVE